ncbi:S41 family peptidase [Thalassomonas actiniarum]|uniref:S41 family peptidase n=1 Tax=Thalassomonas actiniarum TaxID=485447 RepID=A0AAE9YXR9_9GAMM|nr:S41 family peptidase [Thalassomonas actiniarum]WDE02512.1 S41 family peptidase [Thalassomonas actiniarum]
MKFIKFTCFTSCLFLSLFSLANTTSKNVGQKVANHSIWQTQGYGYILEVKGDDITFYDITEKHCLINHLESGEYPSSNITVIEGGAELDWGAIHPVRLTPLKALPKLCRQALITSIYDKNYQFSAPLTFDVLWFTFAEHFAFSKEINWDWQAKYPLWKKKITAQMNEAQLAQVFEQLLTELGDAHAHLESKDGRILASHNIKWDDFKKNKIEMPFATQSEFSSHYEFHMGLNKKQAEIIASYFIGDVKPQRLNRSFLLGQLPREISYFSIDDMSEFTEEDTVLSDLETVDKVMKKILPTLHKSKGLIIDLRWNAGGYDVVSNRLLSYLIERPLYIGSKSTKLKNGFSQPRKIEIQPAESEQYQGPIVVLTSGLTMSAGEIFLIGLAARENVTIIGEASNGGFSDSLPKQLPNGWTFALSNERYLDFAGKNHEYSGYPVAQQHEYLNVQALKESRDYALESAIKLLQ